jgi:hypothetical protein
MLLSLAIEPVLELKGEAMLEAIKDCEKLIGNVRKTTLGKTGMSNTALLKNLVIMELLNREPHQATRTVMMKKYWMHYAGHEEWDDMMLSFDHSGLIKTKSVGNQILYEMPDNQVDEMKKFMAGKLK